MPPLHEQKLIVSYIVAINEKLDSLIDLSLRQVQLSEDRRTALISAAVTGKIDVRNWQPPPNCQLRNNGVQSKEIAA